MRVIACEYGTEAFDEAVAGYVRAERINNVVAKPETKRHQNYLQYVQDQVMGEPAVDPAEPYRDRELVPRALQAYSLKHQVKLTTGRLYFMDDFQISAYPDAVEASQIGLTVHVRQKLETYLKAVERGIGAEMRRHAQAMMLVTGLPFWIHLNYFEDAETLTRKLYEHDLRFDRLRAAQLEEALISFVGKSRFRAAEAANG